MIKLIATGIILGLSNIIPGVSGGTMAVVFGVYDRLIAVITPNVKKIISMWKFWLPLGIGMLIGIMVFSNILAKLFEYYPIPTNWFFIGLVLGSLPLIVAKIRASCPENTQSPPLSVVIPMLIAFAILVVTDTLQSNTVGETVFTELNTGVFMRLFFSSVTAAIAMIIPGISGSFLLVVFGTYETILTATAQLNIPLLIPVALGVIAGLLGGAGAVRLLVKKAPAQTYGAILGLVAGSIVSIYPGYNLNIQLLFSILALTAGFTLSFFSSRTKQNNESTT
ncbi:MAG: DUF368 domain-containing protein [Spirochaetales bacterium]